MVLLISGLHDCRDRHRAFDIAVIGKSIPFKTLGLLWAEVSGRGLYLPYGCSYLGCAWHFCDKMGKPHTDGDDKADTLPARHSRAGCALPDTGGG